MTVSFAETIRTKKRRASKKKLSNSSQDLPWTEARIIDEVVFCLCSLKDCTVCEDTGVIHISHKYIDRAELLLYRIPVWDPPPEFVINTSDLTQRIKQELAEHGRSPGSLNRIMIKAVGRILEGVNERYYYLSGIVGRIRWRLDA